MTRDSLAISSRYRLDGYVAPLSAISQPEVTVLRAEIANARAKLGEAAGQILRHKPHLVLPSFAALVRDSRVTDVVAELLGDDLLCWTTNLFAKEPQDGMRVSWHQDGTYWGLTSNEVVTAWVALTPSVPENGCLRVIPGSHMWPQQPHRDTYAADNLLTRGQEITVEVDQSQAVDVVLNPGEMSLHHVCIAHASEPNRSPNPRIGVAIRYVAADVAQEGGLVVGATLARGKYRFGHFNLEPEPAMLADEQGLAAHSLALEEASSLLHRSATARQRAGTGREASGAE